MAIGFLVLIRHLDRRVQQVREERDAKRWTEGRSHGRAEADRRWREWDTRRREAYQRNDPFTERPPGRPPA